VFDTIDGVQVGVRVLASGIEGKERRILESKQGKAGQEGIG
jgi:hypothetical protein